MICFWAFSVSLTPTWESLNGLVQWALRQTFEGPPIFWLSTKKAACFSEELKCRGARDATCRLKAEDITPSIAWRREAWKEEALDDLPWKDGRGPSSIRRTLELFQTQSWGNVWETGRSAYGLFRAHRNHLELYGWRDAVFRERVSFHSNWMDQNLGPAPQAIKGSPSIVIVDEKQSKRRFSHVNFRMPGSTVTERIRILVRLCSLKARLY